MGAKSQLGACLPRCPHTPGLRPGPINGSVSLSDACFVFPGSPVIALWLEVDGMGEGGCCPGNSPPFARLPILCPRPELQWLLSKQGQRWHFPRTVVQGLPLFLPRRVWWLVGTPFSNPSTCPSLGAGEITLGPSGPQCPPEISIPGEMAD